MRRRAGAAGRLAAMGRLVFACALVVGAGRSARAQDTRARFEISAVGDSTVQFRTGGLRWVRPGLAGLIVDPRRRDALVACVTLLSADSVATALVVGQTTPVTTAHVVLLTSPRSHWYSRGTFWAGAAVGAVAGAVAGVLVERR